MSSFGIPDPQQPQSPDAAPAAPASAPPPSPDALGAPPAAPAKPALWRNLLQGALEGMAGAQGATSFGGGFAGGVGGVMVAKARRDDMAMKQRAADRADAESNAQIEAQRTNTAVAQQRLSQMPTEAADTHQTATDTSNNANLDAADKAQRLGLLPLTAQFTGVPAAAAVAQAYNDSKAADTLPPKARDAHDTMQSGLGNFLGASGVHPFLVSDNTHNDVVGALNQAGTQQPLPQLMNLTIGGKHVAYDLEALSRAPQGLMLVNQVRAMNGQPPVTVPPSPQQLDQATKFLAPAFSKSPNEAKGQAIGYKSILDARKADPNADPAMIKSLESLASLTKQRADEAAKGDRSDRSADAYANASAQKQAKLDVDEKAYLRFAANDSTGWTPKPGMVLSEQQIAAADAKFVSGPLKIAQMTEKSYEMFQNAYDARKNAKTGAGSMLALSTHLATTFGGVPGNRITEAMIHKHLGARSIPEEARVAIQRLVNGDALSEGQWGDFKTLISEARAINWKNAVQSAHALGLPVTSDILPADLPGSFNKAGAAPDKNKHADLGFVPSKGN